jgi:copper chaperone CopZ
MTKLGSLRTIALAGALGLAATSVALACTTKSATVVGRLSVASAPAGSQCAAAGQTCSFFEVMSATNSDGLALGDLTGKTLKAVMAPGFAVPASTPEAIWVAKADVNWEKGMLQVASVEPASEPVAMAAKASWEKCMTAAAVASTMPAGGKSGCCMSGATAATATANSSGCCASKASAASASSSGSCAGKADAASAGGSCHGAKSAKAEAAAAAARALTLNVSGMTCAGCVSKVEKALMGVKGVASATVDLEKKNAVVNVGENVKAEELVKAIEAAGFHAQIAAAEKDAEARG